MKTPKILIIAGSDPSGGAGIQTDIKTATNNKTYAAAVISCLTVQNTQKVSDVFYPPISFLKEQIISVLEDIDFDVIKIGMLGKSEIIDLVFGVLEEKSKNKKIVLDPVMVATSGDILLEKTAIEKMKEVMKKSFLITPNIDEAEILADMKISDQNDIKKAALKLSENGAKNIFIKAGHLKSEKVTNILLDENKKFYIIENDRLNFNDIHGTGCALASAISCNLAQEKSLYDAVNLANKYIFENIKNNISVGKGSAILKHFD